MPSTHTVSVSVARAPTAGSASPRGSASLPFTSSRNYPRHHGADTFIVPAGAPTVLPMGSVVTGRFLYLVVTGGEVRLRITSPDGATQVIPVTGAFLLDNPLLATDTAAVFTALTVEMTLVAPATQVEVEYTVAGDA